MINSITQTVKYIKASARFNPEYGIILGTGLGKFIKEIELKTLINYSSIPNFPVSTVESHEGKLHFGFLGGKKVMVMQGRFHYYEGYNLKEVTFPIRVMKQLGVKNLFISNACGCLNHSYKKGDLMIIKDHINLLPGNPLIGKNYEVLGPRFPDMSNAYDKDLIKNAEIIAYKYSIKVHKGVYAAVTGPNLETKAEYRFLKTIGADVVGMSTVPEVIAANHTGIKVFGISVITDECFPETLKPVSLQEILSTASEAEPKMTLLLQELIAELPN